jgi:peptide/nickel transport system ATP-binding protein
MYAGRVVEHASTETIFNAPEHPYTWGLLKSIPRLDSPRDEQLVPIPGRPPSLITLPGGCSFHPRCPYVRERHKHVDPKLEPVTGQPGHSVACLLGSDTRKRMWGNLRDGKEPAEVRSLEQLEEKPA